MRLKMFMKKRERLVRSIYVGICLMGTIVSIYFGYQFFHDRMVLFGVFTVYIFLMTGVAIWFGLYILAMLFL